MRLRTIVAVLVAMAALIAAITALPAGAQDDGGKKKVLKIGWGQDVQTLNPFVAQDEENYRIWALNWDLLVNFNPDDVSPAPGIAERNGDTLPSSPKPGRRSSGIPGDR